MTLQLQAAVSSLARRARARMATIAASTPSASISNYEKGGNGRRSFSSQDRLKALQSIGIVDDVGFTRFETLHDLQVNSCHVYEHNKLFGTFKANGDGGVYEWMTYTEFNDLVGKTRAALKDIGELLFAGGYLSPLNTSFSHYLLTNFILQVPSSTQR